MANAIDPYLNQYGGVLGGLAGSSAQAQYEAMIREKERAYRDTQRAMGSAQQAANVDPAPKKAAGDDPVLLLLS